MATAFGWSISCVNSTGDEIFANASNGTADTFVVNGENTTKEATCTLSFNATDATPTLLESGTLSFEIITGDPLLYVGLDGYESTYEAKNAILITAIPPLNSSAPSWIVNCT